ncbi:MAG: hypothetical protein OXU20_25960, partial [Myxococcales bacterium]|nr:hypothetical protein [Myxococcales bacterium]
MSQPSKTFGQHEVGPFEEALVALARQLSEARAESQARVERMRGELEMTQGQLADVRKQLVVVEEAGLRARQELEERLAKAQQRNAEPVANWLQQLGPELRCAAEYRVRAEAAELEVAEQRRAAVDAAAELARMQEQAEAWEPRLKELEEALVEATAAAKREHARSAEAESKLAVVRGELESQEGDFQQRLSTLEAKHGEEVGRAAAELQQAEAREAELKAAAEAREAELKA